MYIKTKESIITPNNDGTYKVELPNVDFADTNGSLINGTIIFPRTKTDLIENNGEYEITPLLELETVGDKIFAIEISD